MVHKGKSAWLSWERNTLSDWSRGLWGLASLCDSRWCNCSVVKRCSAEMRRFETLLNHSTWNVSTVWRWHKTAVKVYSFRSRLALRSHERHTWSPPYHRPLQWLKYSKEKQKCSQWSCNLMKWTKTQHGLHFARTLTGLGNKMFMCTTQTIIILKFLITFHIKLPSFIQRLHILPYMLHSHCDCKGLMAWAEITEVFVHLNLIVIVGDTVAGDIWAPE